MRLLSPKKRLNVSHFVDSPADKVASLSLNGRICCCMLDEDAASASGLLAEMMLLMDPERPVEVDSEADCLEDDDDEDDLFPAAARSLPAAAAADDEEEEDDDSLELSLTGICCLTSIMDGWFFLPPEAAATEAALASFVVLPSKLRLVAAETEDGARAA